MIRHIVENKEPYFKKFFKELLEKNSFMLIKEDTNSILGQRDNLFLELKRCNYNAKAY